jgi:hypothetical protein
VTVKAQKNTMILLQEDVHQSIDFIINKQTSYGIFKLTPNC